MNIIVAMKEDEQLFLNALRKLKNINSLFNAQKIIFVFADDSFHNGHFSIEPILKRLDELKELARNKSMNGLYVIGYYAGKILEEAKFLEIYRGECKWHEAVKKDNFFVSVLCLYRFLSKRVEEQLATCHHVILKQAVTKSGIQ